MQQCLNIVQHNQHNQPLRVIKKTLNIKITELLLNHSFGIS